MSMKPDLSEVEENVTEVNLDGDDGDTQGQKTEDEMDLFNGIPIDDEEKKDRIAEAFGLDPEEDKDDSDPEDKDDDSEETETSEEKKETEDEEPEKKDEPKKTEVDWESDANPYKKNYADSTREVNEVLLPAKLERDALLKEKADQDDWISERNEIRGILRSDPDLLNDFLAKSETYVPDKKDVPRVSGKPDQAAIDEAVKKTIGEDGIRMLADQKEKTQKERLDAIGEFEKAHPGLTSEERGLLATQTTILEATMKIPLSDALERSFNATFPERAFESERKKMEEDARVRAAKRDGAKITTTGASHSAGSKPAAPKLTARDVKMAKAFGLTPEELLDSKDDE